MIYLKTLSKKFLLVMSMLLLVLMVNAQQSVLTINFYSAETYKVSLENKPEITFEGDDFVIKGKDVFASFSRKGIKEFYFDKSSSSVKEVHRNTFKMEWETDRLINLYGENLMPVRVFDLYGRERRITVRDEGDKTVLELERLNAGSYILSVNNKRNIKIILR